MLLSSLNVYYGKKWKTGSVCAQGINGGGAPKAAKQTQSHRSRSAKSDWSVVILAFKKRSLFA